jgi:hypothetical protein
MPFTWGYPAIPVSAYRYPVAIMKPVLIRTNPTMR